MNNKSKILLVIGVLLFVVGIVYTGVTFNNVRSDVQKKQAQYSQVKNQFEQMKAEYDKLDEAMKKQYKDQFEAFKLEAENKPNTALIYFDQATYVFTSFLMPGIIFILFAFVLNYLQKITEAFAINKNNANVVINEANVIEDELEVEVEENNNSEENNINEKNNNNEN